MKTLGHVVITLIVALVIIGATYALLQAVTAQALASNPTETSADRSALPEFANGQSALPGEMSEGPAGGPEGRGGSWGTAERNLLEIAAIVAAVQAVWSIGRRVGRQRRRLYEKIDSTQVAAAD